MEITDLDIETVRTNQPDKEGSFSEIYLRPEAALKVVPTDEQVIEENLSRFEAFMPETTYTEIGDDSLVKQERADKVYEVEDFSDLEAFLEDTREAVEAAEKQGYALDFKPGNFGSYGRESLYIDNTDIASFRSPQRPLRAMATQLEEVLSNSDSYSGQRPSTKELVRYWKA